MSASPPFRENITCKRCRFRHPADRTCEDAAYMAERGRIEGVLHGEIESLKQELYSFCEPMRELETLRKERSRRERVQVLTAKLNAEGCFVTVHDPKDMP